MSAAAERPCGGEVSRIGDFDMGQDSDKEGISRRDAMKIGLAVGAIGAVAATEVALLTPLLQGPPLQEVRKDPLVDQIRYSRFPAPQWWNDREGEPMRVTDFQEWQGATGVWRGLYQDGRFVPGTGFPVLVIRVKRDDSVFRAPEPGEVSLPTGFGLYYDDPSRDIRIVAVYDRCAHLCCYPGWQVVQNPPPARDYVSDAPTYTIYGLDPIYCVCHGSQYDPMILVRDVNPRNNAKYVGPSRVHGPSSRAIPIIPLKAVSDILVGGMPESSWYADC
jgi:Rieske Fe-S protein